MDNSDSCKKGCNTLWDLTDNNRKSVSLEVKKQITVENKVKAGAAGGIEAVVKAINTHIDNSDVCEKGCGALWNMVVFNGNSFVR